MLIGDCLYSLCFCAGLSMLIERVFYQLCVITFFFFFNPHSKHETSSFYTTTSFSSFSTQHTKNPWSIESKRSQGDAGKRREIRHAESMARPRTPVGDGWERPEDTPG